MRVRRGGRESEREERARGFCVRAAEAREQGRMRPRGTVLAAHLHSDEAISGRVIMQPASPAGSSAAVPCCPCIAIGHRKRLEHPASRCGEVGRRKQRGAAGGGEARASGIQRAPGRRNCADARWKIRRVMRVSSFAYPSERCLRGAVRPPPGVVVTAYVLRWWCSDAPVVLRCPGAAPAPADDRANQRPRQEKEEDR